MSSPRRKTFDLLIERYINTPDPAPADLGLADRLAASVREAVDDAARSMSAAPPPLLDVQGVADRLAVSVRTVETLITEGELIPIRVRSARRFTPEAVDDYLRRAAKPKRRR